MNYDAIKIRIKFVKYGGRSLSLEQLINASENLMEFFNQVAEDIGLLLERNKWLASEFKSSDLAYNLSYGDIDQEKAKELNDKLQIATRTEIKEGIEAEVISLNARRKLLEAADALEVNDKLELAFYDNERAPKPKMKHSISKQEAVREIGIIQDKQKKIIALKAGKAFYYGGIKGKAVLWHKEGKETYFEVKDLRTGENVRCIYDDNMYQRVHALFEKRDSILNISGKITRDRKENKIESIEIEKIRVNESAQYYKEGDLDKFFGCAPGITGGLTPREYIDKIRNEK